MSYAKKSAAAARHSTEWPALAAATCTIPKRRRLRTLAERCTGERTTTTRTEEDASETEVGDMYFEKQVSGLCAVHALNNAIGECVFDEEDLQTAVVELGEEMAAAAAAVGGACFFSPSDHMSPGGYFSDEVMAIALQRGKRWAINQTPLCQKPEGMAYLLKAGVVGAVVHVPGHWFALRHSNRRVWRLDSLANGPVCVGSIGGTAVATFEATYTSVFAVETVATDPETERPNDNRGEDACGSAHRGNTPTTVGLTEGEEYNSTCGSAQVGEDNAEEKMEEPRREVKAEAENRADAGESPATPASRDFDADVDLLLETWSTGGDVQEMLRRLPQYYPETAQVQMSDWGRRLQRGASSWLGLSMDTGRAAFMRIPFWRTTNYCLSVVCEALGRSTGTPQQTRLRGAEMRTVVIVGKRRARR